MLTYIFVVIFLWENNFFGQGKSFWNCACNIDLARLSCALYLPLTGYEEVWRTESYPPEMPPASVPQLCKHFPQRTSCSRVSKVCKNPISVSEIFLLDDYIEWSVMAKWMECNILATCTMQCVLPGFTNDTRLSRKVKNLHTREYIVGMEENCGRLGKPYASWNRPLAEDMIVINLTMFTFSNLFINWRFRCRGN